MPPAPVPRDRWTPPSRRRVLALRDRLREIYGRPAMAPHGAPLDELILTVLSQSTNDRNRDVAFLRLRERLPTWEAVRDAPLEQVEEAIRPGGISRVKSARIQAILRALTPGGAMAPAGSGGDADGGGGPGGDADGGGDAAAGERPVDDLQRLARLPVAAARAELCALPGVGRKTAACVLLFSFGMEDVPVDTHVSRVGTRLGLFRPGAPFEELHDDLLALTPRGGALELHVNLLRHGRRTCHAQRPRCDECALRRRCPSAASLAPGRRLDQPSNLL
jgi:endonuclease-3